jgi:hypothetical protein
MEASGGMFSGRSLSGPDSALTSGVHAQAKSAITSAAKNSFRSSRPQREEREMRRMAWVTVAAAVLGLAIGGISLASHGPANNGNPLVLHLLSRATAINNFVDTGPPGWSPGDLYVFSDRLFLASAPDDQIGTSDGRCALIDPVAFSFDCSITNSIFEGQTLTAGEVMAAGKLTLVEGTTSTLAIAGGIGAYRTVRGDASVDLGPFEGPHQVTVNLVLNP